MSFANRQLFLCPPLYVPFHVHEMNIFHFEIGGVDGGVISLLTPVRVIRRFSHIICLIFKYSFNIWCSVELRH